MDLFSHNSKIEDAHSYIGTVERIIFYSDTSHYAVARFQLEKGDDGIVIVGIFPGIQEGERLQVFGDWINHKRFGKQFQVSNYHPLSPNTLDGVIHYLGSGIVEGIGKKLAGRIVEKFGLDTLQVIEDEPHRLGEVSGLGQKRVQRLIEEIQKRRAGHSLQIFLRSLGLTGVTLQSIHNTYGDDSIKVLQHNPYILIDEVANIGFKRADQIAEKLGIEKDSPQRGKAALSYILKKGVDEGSTCLPREEIIQKSHHLTSIDSGLLSGFLDEEVAESKLIREEEDIFLPYIHRIEVSAARLSLSLLEKGLSFSEFPSEVFRRGDRYSEEQQRAIETALAEKILILTGGPGVGKTYTVLGISQIFESQGLAIALCAPTGRAAKRLQESTLLSAMTIHRLLKYQPQRGFYHNASQPLEVDVVIVDESSMMDIFLFTNLLRALPRRARLILVGDKDQLPPVGPGSPFCDLIRSGMVPTVHLTKIFRQKEGSMIIQNAHKIQRGDMPDLNTQSPGDFYFVERDDTQKILGIVEKLVTEKIPYQFSIPQQQIQILTPMRKGVLGYENLNQHLQGLFNPGGKVVGEVGPYILRVGDKIMQIKNNYDKEVFNGDIGFIVEKDGSKIVVDFGDHIVYYEPKGLKELVLAYAISVHKSQGSEYPCVIMPIVPEHTILLRRNLVYTAITRGVKLVIVLGSTRSLAMAVRKAPAEKRHGRFLERLKRGTREEERS